MHSGPTIHSSFSVNHLLLFVLNMYSCSESSALQCIFINPSAGGARVIAIGLCVSACVFPRNLGECFVSLLVEPLLERMRVLLINNCGNF